MDHIGPFRLTKDGHLYAILLIDYSTKWVEGRAVASTDAASACSFIEDVIARHGVPKELISDNGTAYTARSFEAMCDKWGIRHVQATPVHPETNGLIERLNKTLSAVISAHVSVGQDDWDRKLPLALFAINSSRIRADEVHSV